MSYKIINNFLDKEHLSVTQGLIFDTEFPWRRREELVTNANDGIYFTHCFYNDMESTSPNFTTVIKPILIKLKCIAPIQIRSNMFISKLFKKSDFHTDYKNTKSKTALFYLNTCDGGTYIGDKFIPSIENQILLFDPSNSHQSTNCTDEKCRFNININYR